LLLRERGKQRERKWEGEKGIREERGEGKG